MKQRLVETPWRPTPPQELERMLAREISSAPEANFLRSLPKRLQLRPLRRARADKNTQKIDAGPTPPLESLVFSRAAFGSTPDDVESFRAMGDTPRERLENWVDWQLEPEAIPDGDLEVRLAACNYQTLDKTLGELWGEHVAEFEDIDHRLQPIFETQHATLLRAVFSRRQLAEVLADFWHNHFNVHGFHFYAGPTFPHYDRDVIRAHSLGNFRQFLEAMTRSPAMLFYLDNIFNSADGPNENFARELFELHTLGEENYYGAIPAHQVPTYDNGVPKGYTDEDVREFARCLTGWSLDRNTGAFSYRWSWHDNGAKKVLGLDLPARFTALADVGDVYDLLATHPGVAHFVCFKLCRRLVADDPPAALVEAAAATFLENADRPDQLKRVVRTILVSDEFAATWGDKVRRPFELVMSGVRAMGADFTLPLGVDFSRYFFYLTYTTGQLPHTWAPPTGFPDRKEIWLTTNALVTSWRLLNLLTGLELDGWRPCDPLEVMPDHLQTAGAIVDHWIDRALLRPVNDSTRSRLVDFLSNGGGPEVPLDLTNQWAADRVRSVVGLILLSPDFLWR